MGRSLDIDEADVSVVLDDSMVKGVEPWGWHGVRSINEKVREKGCQLVMTRHDHDHLLQFMGKRPFPYRLATLDGDASFAGLWVDKDDLTHERCLGAIAAVDPGIISIEAVEAYLLDKTKDEHRAQAARDAYDATLRRIKVVSPGQGIDWPHKIPVLPKWHEFEEGGVVLPAVPRGFKMGPRGQKPKRPIQTWDQ